MAQWLNNPLNKLRLHNAVNNAQNTVTLEDGRVLMLRHVAPLHTQLNKSRSALIYFEPSPNNSDEASRAGLPCGYLSRTTVLDPNWLTNERSR